MLNNDSLPNDLEPFEDRLRALAPAPARLDRDTLMFRAGGLAAGRAGARSATVWRSVAAVATLVSAVLGGVLAVRAPNRVRQLTAVPDPARTTTSVPFESAPDRSVSDRVPAATRPAATSPWLHAARYAALRDSVLADGTDALPAAAVDGVFAMPKAFVSARDLGNDFQADELDVDIIGGVL